MFTVMLLFCRLSGVEKFSPNLSMENMDLGSNLAMMEDIEFEEKVVIEYSFAFKTNGISRN